MELLKHHYNNVMNDIKENKQAVTAAEGPVNPPRIIVAIDGHAASGKSTMASTLAKTVGYTYIDTGAMYRAVTLYAIETGIAAQTINTERLGEEVNNICIEFHPNETTGRSEVWLNGRCVESEIRTSMEVVQLVSLVATVTPVRKRMVALQQEMGRNKGVVMDGRDIGTVVFPEAELKVFVSAPPEVRAKRRFEELKAKGETQSLQVILSNLKLRDRIDATREDSPLKMASDSIFLNNSFMTIDEQHAWLLNEFNRVTGNGRV